MTREVLRGLSYLHELEDQDLVHRDVTPASILCSYEGQVKLADFGLARWRDRLAQTLVGERWIPSPYQSPEQRRGLALDARSDVHAVGLILWELLTGRRAVEPGSTLMGVAMLPPPSRVVPQLPHDIDDLVMTALAEDPGDRYASAAAFAARLTALLTATQDGSRLKAFLDELFEVEREREADEERAMVSAAERTAAEAPAPELPKPVAPPPTPATGVSLVEGALARELSRTPPASQAVSRRRRVGGWLIALAAGAAVVAVVNGPRTFRTGAPDSPPPASELRSPPVPAPAAPVPVPPPAPKESPRAAPPPPSRPPAGKPRAGVGGPEARRLGARFLARGEQMLRQGRLQEATSFAEAARAAGLTMRSRLLLGKVLLASGRPAEARTEFEFVLRHDPGNRAAREGKAVAQQRLSQAASPASK